MTPLVSVCALQPLELLLALGVRSFTDLLLLLLALSVAAAVADAFFKLLDRLR